MGYYSRHSIFLLKADIQKLKLIQDLLAEKDISFLICKKNPINDKRPMHLCTDLLLTFNILTSYVSLL